MEKQQEKPKFQDLNIDYKVTAHVGKFKFSIPVGFGYKTLTWLALCASQQYSEVVYPQGHYLPCRVAIQGKGYYDSEDGAQSQNFSDVPHPALRIVDYIKKMFTQENCKKEDIKWYVDIKKAGQLSNLTKEQQRWYQRAFGPDRNKMTLQFQWMEQNRSYFKYEHLVTFKYVMFEELQQEFKYLNYSYTQKKNIEWPLKRIKSDTKTKSQLAQFQTVQKLPFGKISDIQYWMIKKSDDSKVKLNTEKSAQSFHTIIPDILVSKYDSNKVEYDRGEKIFKDISAIKEEDDDMEDQKPINVGECPFTAESIAQALDLNKFIEDDVEENKILAIINEHLKDLYNIFYHYSTFYKQCSEVKVDRAIIWQDMQYILKYYMVYRDKQSLKTFLEQYENDTKTQKFEDVVWTINTRRGVKFPEFLIILIRSSIFIIDDILDCDKDIHQQVKQIITQIIEMDRNEEEMTEFSKHMRFNSELIQLLRDLSENLLYIFAYKLRESDMPYYMYKEDLITLITENDLTGDNFENLVDLCLAEIVDKDNYSGFNNGIFYYEFLQVLQWLALIYVQSTQEEIDEMEDENVEITEEALLEKTQYFIENLINNYHAVLEQLIEDDENEDYQNTGQNDSEQDNISQTQ